MSNLRAMDSALSVTPEDIALHYPANENPKTNLGNGDLVLYCVEKSWCRIVSPGVDAFQFLNLTKALRINPEEVQLCVNGIKKISIRRDHRDIQAGETLVLYCPELMWCMLVIVSSVRHTIYKDITDEESHDDGYSARTLMTVDMKGYYPDLQLDTLFSVIRWDS